MSEEQLPGTATMESLFLYLSATSATVVLSVRLLCLRDGEDPSVLPCLHTAPQPPFLHHENGNKVGHPNVSHSDTCVWVPTDSFTFQMFIKTTASQHLH